MPENTATAAILFAEVAGSTALIQALGEFEARRVINELWVELQEHVRKHQGQLVINIGDEWMCAFPTAEAAAAAARAMQVHVDARLRDLPLSLRVGFHWGPVTPDGSGYSGETVNIAARVAALASADRILLTSQARDQLPRTLTTRAVPYKSTSLPGIEGGLDLFELLWREDARTSREPRSERTYTTLRLRLGGIEYAIEAGQDPITLGRVEDNRIVIKDELVSARHATIEFRDGAFVLTDTSLNGVWFAFDGSPDTFKAPRELTLREAGRLWIGRYPRDPEAVCVRYLLDDERTITKSGSGRQTLPAPQLTERDEEVWAPGIRILGGQYVVRQLLGEGGIADVYLVTDAQVPAVRFAVKRMRATDRAARDHVLKHAQTWIDLPESPYVVACRFFRTEGNRILVFSDHVNGGTLADWIADGRLDRIDQILDIAIQTAWGLHSVHEFGIVHQDVKPGNVLLTTDGVAKIADIAMIAGRADLLGSAEGGARGVSQDTGPENALLSRDGIHKVVDFGLPGSASRSRSGSYWPSRGWTPAYCSPEQAEMAPTLTRRSDIWSWAITVLEMFTGGITWDNGPSADRALERYLQEDHTVGRPDMPNLVATVLRRCLQRDPSARYSSMLEVAQGVMDAYAICVGKAYPRPRPEFASTFGDRAALSAQEMSRDGMSWTSGREQLRRALAVAGRDSREADYIADSAATSRKALAVAELSNYEEAKRIYEALTDAGAAYQRIALAGLLAEKSRIHTFLEDLVGAISESDRAIALFEDGINREGRRGLSTDLAAALFNKADALTASGDLSGALANFDRALSISPNLVEAWRGKAAALRRLGRAEEALAAYDRALEGDSESALTWAGRGSVLEDLGRLDEALAAYDRAIAIFEGLTKTRPELTSDLAGAYLNKGNALQAQGKLAGALVEYDRAIEIRERLVKGGRSELENRLADAVMNKALALRASGHLPQALAGYDRAIEIYARLVVAGRSELENDLARAVMNEATALADSGHLPQALAEYDRAIEIYARLVAAGRSELENELAGAVMNKAALLQGSGQLPQALVEYDRAIEIRERLVKGGRRELANGLAMTHMNRANALRNLARYDEALAGYDAAIEIRKTLISREGRHELANDLAAAFVNKANAMQGVGRFDEALGSYDQAIEMYETLINREGRREQAHALAAAWMNKANAQAQSNDLANALNSYERAIGIQEQLGQREGRTVLSNDLARTHMNRAAALTTLGDKAAALADYARAIDIYDEAIDRQGRNELANDLIVTLMNRANAWEDSGEAAKALVDYDRAIAISERLVNEQGRIDLTTQLAQLLRRKADVLSDVGQFEAASIEFERAFSLLRPRSESDRKS